MKCMVIGADSVCISISSSEVTVIVKYLGFEIKPEFRTDPAISLAVCLKTIYINLWDSDSLCINMMGTSDGHLED